MDYVLRKNGQVVCVANDLEECFKVICKYSPEGCGITRVHHNLYQAMWITARMEKDQPSKDIVDRWEANLAARATDILH